MKTTTQINIGALRRLHALTNKILWEAVTIREDHRGAESESKGHLDPVTKPDKWVQHFLIDALRSLFKDDHFVGEEKNGIKDPRMHLAELLETARERFVWVFDPICGTFAYAAGLPIYATNCACLYDGQVVAAAIASGTHPDELLIAWRGGGAWRLRQDGSRRPLTVSPRSNVVNLDTGMGFKFKRPRWAADTMYSLYMANRFKIMALGSSDALAMFTIGELAGCVAGACDVWDEGAAVLIAREAGGIVTHIDGSEWTPEGCLAGKGLLLASTEEIHVALRQTVPLIDDYESQTGDDKPSYAEQAS